MEKIFLPLKKMLPKRILYWQIAFTVFAFAMMVIISYFIMNTAIRSHLSRNSDAVLDLAIAKIEIELRGPETTLRTFAEGAQQRVVQGADIVSIRELLRSFNSHLLFHSKDGTTPVTLFGVFYTLGPEPVFLHNDDWLPFPGYDVQSRPWYQAAMMGEGNPIRSELYLDFSVGQYVFSIAQCIHDESGRLLGVVSLQIPVGIVGEIVIQTAEEQGGYGMILGQDLKVHSHANRSFVGMEVPDPALPFSIFYESFLKGEDVFERPIISFAGESSLAFLRKTQDGWYYGMVVPSAPYYRSITNIWYALVALGTVAAAFLIFMLINTDAKKNRATALTNALNKMSEIFLSQSGKTFADIISVGGRPVVDLIDIDRFSIFRNFQVDGILHTSQIYRWEKASGGTTKPNDSFVNITYAQTVPSWEQIFKERKAVNGPVRLMPEREAATLSKVGIISAFAAPIYINDDFWGFALFEEHIKERVFDNSLAETMRSAAFLFANAVMRTELESQLASERDFTQKIIDAAPIGLNIWDDNFNLIGCNDAIQNIFGKPKQYYIDNFHKFSPEYQPDGVKSADKIRDLQMRVHTGMTVVSEWEHCTDTGEPIPCEITMTRVDYNNKHILLVYLYDLRNQKKMEKAVLDAEQTRALIDAVPLSCTLIDKNSNILSCNESAVKFFRLSKKDDIQRMFVDLMPEYQPDGSYSVRMAEEAVRKAFDDGYVFIPEWTHRSLEGDLLPCEVTLVRVEYGGDHVIAGYARDMRAAKEAEAKAKEAAEAEAANRAKSSFLATMSHEIRTPMNAILGITEIQLQNKKLLPDTKDALNIIYNSGYSLLGIINDLLDLSKIEAGKLELIDSRYETASLIHDTINLNTARIGSKPIEFKLHVDENLPFELIGDELRVKQILNNLLSNAFKYTDSGEVSLSFSTETADKQVTLTIVVRDTGQGMTGEQMQNLFDAYSRFNMKANRFVEGTGLGMNIVQHLVNMMGGDISVQSEIGKGTEVTVHLTQGYAGSAKLGSEVVESLKGFRMGGMSKVKKAQIVREYMPYGKVLVVDDMETNLYVAKGFLLPYELKVETALSGIEAIKKIERGDIYDIVFMDHMMPVMDGIEAVREIRGKGYTRPIIALTANAVAGQADMFMANGFDGFISKPIDIRELNASLNKYVRDRQPAEVVEAARAAYGDGIVADTESQLDPELAKVFTNDAERAMGVIQGYEGRGTYEGADLQMYIINVHALKSALANIGETKLSGLAGELEEAGRERNTAYITDETPAFLKGLRVLVEKLKVGRDEDGGVEATEEDLAYMGKMLTTIKEACAEYDVDAALAALAELKQRPWPSEYGELLDTISEHLLHSDFDEAEAVCAARLSDG